MQAEHLVATDGTANLDHLGCEQTVTLQVLVVDDDRAVRVSMLRLLTAYGYAATGAGSAQEAFDLARQMHPHAILMDILLKDEDGADLARALKQDPMLATTPIIALTASPDLIRDDADLFRAVLTKPCPSEYLFRTIEECVSRSSLLQ